MEISPDCGLRTIRTGAAHPFATLWSAGMKTLQLPPELGVAEVIGHGMNADELAANVRLTRRFVQGFNRDPALSIETDGCDSAPSCVGVQYLQGPVQMFAEPESIVLAPAPPNLSSSTWLPPWRSVLLGGELLKRSFRSL